MLAGGSRGPASLKYGKVLDKMSIRAVKRIMQSRSTTEGAGVRLRRAFGFGDTAETDPFLLFDDFRNDRPQDYLAGFPWHPHRGIETITYVPPGKRKTLKAEVERHAFAYVFEGSGTFRAASQPQGVLTERQVDGAEIVSREMAADRSLVLFDSGDEVTVQAGDQGIRFLLVSGKPIEEPAAWYGPIVMNTQAELQQAVSELRNGTFISRP